MKILLIAPSHNSLEQFPEIRQLTSMHRTTVLNGDISVQGIFDAVRINDYDIVHFATHISSNELDKMYISDSETLSLVDTENILKLAKCKLVFLNFCESARFATYLTNRGVDCAIYTTINIEDRLAWRFPIAFYEQLKRYENDELFSYMEIYEKSAPSDGTYGLVAGVKYYNAFFSKLREAIAELKNEIIKLNKMVSEHAILLGAADFVNTIRNRYIIGVVVLFVFILLLASGMTIWQNISNLMH